MTDQAERDRLAREHLPLAERLSAQMARRFADIADADELRSFALAGLATAIDRFDPARGVPFGAYATKRIRGAIYDGMAEASWFPRRLLRQIAFYRRADELLQSAADAPPPADAVETVHRLGDRLKELTAAYVTTYAADADREEAASPAEAEQLLERKRFATRVRAYVATLPDKQRTLVDL